MKPQIAIITLICIVCLPIVLAGTMTRQLSKTTVSPGEVFSIIYNSSTQNPSYWFIDDGIPAGFNLTESRLICQNDWGADNYQEKCRVRINNGALPYVLKVKAPVASGTYTFKEGRYDLWVTDSDQTTLKSFPDMIITVSGGCKPVWSCGDWSECSSGEQARTCRDTSTCAAVSKTETQSCGSPDIMKWAIIIIGGIFGLMLLMQMMQIMVRRR